MARWTLSCHQCGARIELDERPGRYTRCPSCEADVRVCLNCRHHEPSASNQCREPQADYVHRKDRANYCDHHDPKPLGEAQSNQDSDDALAKLNALFRGLDD